jgi:uncharacterized membrane protein (UPF0127 family)
MKKVIRITENDLTRIVKRVLNENVIDYPFPNRKTISIINNEGKTVDVDCELAQTPEEKKQGLLYRDGIEDNCGVLFDSDKNSAYHMVDMAFPIEMIFINGGQIVEIIKAQPGQKNIVPANPFAMNLEVKDGYCDKNNISVGNNVLLGDLINEDEDRVNARKERYIKGMTELAKDGHTWRSLGLSDEQIQFFNKVTLKQITDFMKSKKRFNSNDYLGVSTGTYENLIFDFDNVNVERDEFNTYKKNAVAIYVEAEIYGGTVDLYTEDGLGVESLDTFDVIDVLNGSLDDMGLSDVAWEVGYEVKDIIQDIILFHAPLYYLSHLEFDMYLRT